MKKQNEAEIPDVEKQGWEAEKLIKEAANEESDDVVRKILRGDESKGDPDKRDVAPSPDFDDTPRGREEENKENEKQDH